MSKNYFGVYIFHFSKAKSFFCKRKVLPLSLGDSNSLFKEMSPHSAHYWLPKFT